jgi:hypothetical protein
LQMTLELMGSTSQQAGRFSDLVVKGKLIVRGSSGAVQHPKHS